MSKVSNKFTEFTKEILDELHNNIWTLKISPKASENKNLESFINEASNNGVTNLTPYIDKKYKMVALAINIQKAIYVYTLDEWKHYNME